MKKILLSILCCSCLLSLSAQFKKENMKRYGVKAGVQYGLMNFNAGSPSIVSRIATSWKAGYYVGGLLQVPVSNTISLQPEYLYTYKPGDDNALRVSYDLHYLSLPVLLKIAFFEKFALLVGPEASLLIHASKKENGTTTKFTHETEERVLSAVGGFEAKITGSFFVEARYLHGLNYIGLYQRSGPKEFKWRSVEVGLEYRW